MAPVRPADTARADAESSLTSADAWRTIVSRVGGGTTQVSSSPATNLANVGADAGFWGWGGSFSSEPAPSYADEPKQARTDTGDNWRPFRGRELVVTESAPASFEKAQALGFSPQAPTKLHGLGVWVTSVSLPAGVDVDQARQALQRERPDAKIGLNQTYHFYRVAKQPEGAGVNAGTSDAPAPRLSGPCPENRCYGASLMGWHPGLSTCAKGLRIGVIDTAIDHKHQDFSGRNIKVGTFLGEHVQAPSLHGTGVLALLGGGRPNGTPGLLPNAEFFIADVFFADEKGYLVSDTATLLLALDWLDRFQVKIVNMSLSGPNDPLLEQMIGRLSRKGMVFVAAAGNDGPAGPPSFPAAYKDVIAVTAVSRDLRSYRYASHGQYIDVAAPGVDVWTALPGGGYGYQSGTSFAVPYVTAIVASIYRSTAIKRKSEILRRLSYHDLGPSGRDPVYGLGLLLAPDSCGPATAPAGPLVGRGPGIFSPSGKGGIANRS